MGREQLLHRFAEQQRELTRLQAQTDVPVVMELDLTMQQLRALTLVAYSEGLTAQELAGWLRVSAATVSGLVGRLERRGLVRRERSTTDRRAKELRLTDEGVALLQRLDTAGAELWARLVSELTDDEVSQLVGLTDRIIEILRARCERAPDHTP
ncbi:MAG: MarR family transcriptional regulator [Brachybacterium paraconglomeratum]|nr:MarR family transcriptional regulator [Brachybacterium paraconglomeratum]